MLDSYIDNQPIPYKILVNCKIKNKISHAYLFVSNGYPKVLDFAKSFAKYLLCPKNISNNKNCTSCNQCSNIDKNNFSEIKIIEPDGLWIKKEQLSELQEEFNKKAVTGTKKVYIINHANCLNDVASNSILKFLEEPADNITAILIVDNNYQLLETITSRCQLITLNKIKEEEKKLYSDNLQTRIALLLSTTKEEIEMYSSDDYLEKITSAINFINIYEKKNIEILLETNNLFHNKFSNRNDIIYAFDIFILYYKDILNKICNHKLEIFNEKQREINEIILKNNRNNIINKINIIINAKEQIFSNANTNLLIDKLIIDMEGGIK